MDRVTVSTFYIPIYPKLVLIACLSLRTVMKENKLVPVWVQNVLITKNENAGLWCRLRKRMKCATVDDQLRNFIIYCHCQNDGERL